MSTTAKVVDVSDIPDLRRVAEEVRATREACLLRVRGQDVAIVVPIAQTTAEESVPVLSDADVAAFESAFGAWKGNVDGEALKEQLASARSSSRPPVVL